MRCKAIWIAMIWAVMFPGSLPVYAQQANQIAPVVEEKPFLHPLFSENAVLQRDCKVSIRGWTDAGDSIVIKFDGQQETTQAAPDGRWTVVIPPHAAGGPHSLTVGNAKTGESVQRQNLLFGDVWLCSGQSNMAYDIRGASDPEKEIAAANHPNLRLLRIPGSLTPAPQQSFDKGTWQVCTSKTIIDFAGVGYFFGRDLQQTLNVPIGLIDASASGTVAQAWVSGPALATLPDFKHDVDALATFAAAATRITDPSTPTVLYNGKIAPLLPGQLKGIIWYQGESNADRKSQAIQYRTLLPTLVNDWRKQFGAKMPFYIVQLANFRAPHDQPGNSDVWPLLREAQLTTSEQLKAPLVVTIDLGEVKNVHYQNKQEVGARLLKSVLEHTYGTALESSGPALRNAHVAGASIVLIFDHAEGLHLKGDADRVFAIAGADKNFVWATPHITENTITLSSAEVSAPLYARFAWSDNPLATLYNSDNLPASPFRTSQLDDPGAEDAKVGANLLKQRADAVFDAWNEAFLVRKKGQTYYVRTLKNLGTESEGSWVFALDVEVAEDAYERTRSPEHRQLLNDVLAGFLAQNNYDWTGDTWNDDVAWMTIALVRGYQLTGNKVYLDKAVKGWNIAYTRGWDTKYGGGGVWENMDNFVHGDGKADKLALSNTSLAIPGVMLYQITGDDSYLKKSEAMYDWIRKNVFNAKTGQVNEGVKWIIGKPDSGWLENSNNVYNSGTFVQAANELHRVTGDPAYYSDAVLAISHIMKQPVIADKGRYQTQWQYRFIKGMSQFATDNGQWDKYYSWMMQNAEAAWNNRDSNNLTWNDWLHVTDDPKINACETSSAVGIWQVLPPLDRPELSGKFLIQSAGSKLVLAPLSAKPGAPVMLEPSGGSTFAQWSFEPVGGGNFRIQNATDALSIAVDEASFQAGAKIVQQSLQNDRLGGDWWWVVKNSDGTYSFYNHNSNQAIEIPDRAASAGAHLTQNFANDSQAQRFTLISKR
jgi:sialate O-acetylesterase